MKHYIYVISCLVNNKQYVGKTKNLEARKRDHFHTGPNRKKIRQTIHAAIKKHGVENFVFEVIGEYDFEHEAYLAEEETIISKLNEGIELYNMNSGGKGGISNPIQKVREKMSKARLGITLSEETRKRISESVKEKMKDPEVKSRMKISNATRWQSMDEETKKEKIEKLARSNRGKKKNISEETKTKIAETLKKRADEIGRSSQNIVELIHTCPDCGEEVIRKGVNGWKCHLKSGPCKRCCAKRAWKTKHIKASLYGSSGQTK